jgi:predicted lipoprotein with Yx(FWY)xxD motif
MQLRSLTIALALATTVAACGGGAGGGSDAGGERSGNESANVGTTGATQSAAPGNNAGQVGQNQAPALRVAKSETHGLYLADASGRAVYALREDPANGTVCHGGCERTWPPVLTPTGSANVASDAGLQAQQVGSVKRTDGAQQVSYAGRALYYYASDTGPDQALGHGVADNWGHWQLVRPDGSLSTAPGGPPSEPPKSDQTPRPGHR